jgi:hypothetical protein
VPGIDARLSLGSTVSGQVTGSRGQPLRNICVVAFNASSFGFDSTGKKGRYRIPALSTGRYAVEFLSCDPARNLVPEIAGITVTAPRPVLHLNARLAAGGSVSGTIRATTPAGRPVADECVQVLGTNPGNPGSFAMTGPRGRYQATGLAPGTYQVLLGDQICSQGSDDLAAQWYRDQPTQATAARVHVSSGQVTAGIDATLRADGGISGTVTSTAGRVTGACVTAIPLAGGNPEIAVSLHGRYTLESLIPGRYKVRFSSGCGITGLRTQWWKDASSASHATIIGVAAGQLVTGIDAAMSH